MNQFSKVGAGGTAIGIIQEEHRALAAVLHALLQFVDGVEKGRFKADFSLLAAMIEYITQLPEKVHHPKEDRYLFARLRERCPNAVPLISELESDHRQAPARIQALEHALMHYQAVGGEGRDEFQHTVRRYVDQEWRHMATEEGRLLPLAKQYLTTDDWSEIEAAFAANGNPWAGASGEFAQLFSRIVNLAPPPIGVGPE